MSAPDFLKVFCSRLNQINIPYMITGAAAVFIYGEPRFTNDLDLVVDMKADDITGFLASFPPEEFYRPPEEVVKLEIQREKRGHFNLIHHETGFRADVYAVGSDDLQNWGMKNRKVVKVDSEEIWLAPPEYVILKKLEFYREGRSPKHVRDVRSIVEARGSDLDMEFITERIRSMNLAEVWSECIPGSGR